MAPRGLRPVLRIYLPIGSQAIAWFRTSRAPSARKSAGATSAARAPGSPQGRFACDRGCRQSHRSLPILRLPGRTTAPMRKRRSRIPAVTAPSSCLGYRSPLPRRPRKAGYPNSRAPVDRPPPKCARSVRQHYRTAAQHPAPLQSRSAHRGPRRSRIRYATAPVVADVPAPCPERPPYRKTLDRCSAKLSFAVSTDGPPATAGCPQRA